MPEPSPNSPSNWVPSENKLTEVRELLRSEAFRHYLALLVEMRSEALLSLAEETNDTLIPRIQGQVMLFNHLLGDDHQVRLRRDAGEQFGPTEEELKDLNNDVMPALGQSSEE